jgi:deoxycytidine triphosphate deaminase
MAKYDPKNLWTIPPEDDYEPGVLLSDRIILYVEATHLIEPEDFAIEDLRPASYDLHVGDHYYVNDHRFDLRAKQKLSIPANGLVYIATRERFNIPYYLVARYSLRVTQVYRGLLIDNGLQIDPGYHGRIYIPVHNFTDEARVLTRDDPFLSVDFTKTTGLPWETMSTFTSEPELIRAGAAQKIRGRDDKSLVLFYRRERDLNEKKTPEDFWNRFPGERHESSLLGMDKRLKRSVRNIQFAGIGVVFGFLLGLLPWVAGLYVDSHRDTKVFENELTNLRQEVDRLRSATIPQSQPASQPATKPSDTRKQKGAPADIKK